MADESVQDKEFFEQLRKEFMDEVQYLLEQGEETYLRLDAPESRKEALDETFRIFHSVKGGAAAVGFATLSEFAHEVENWLSTLRSDPGLVTVDSSDALFKAGDAIKSFIAAARAGNAETWTPGAAREAIQRASGAVSSASAPAKTEEHKEARGEVAHAKEAKGTVRVETAAVDRVLDLIGELVVIKSQLLHDSALSRATDIRLHGLLALFDKTIRELQDTGLQMRMTPIKPLFLKLQRVVKELSAKLGKPVEIVTGGEETELDRNLIEQVSDPLMHLIRNAIDHGVETPEDRKVTGKPERATIRLVARQSRERILLEVSDDGRGIDRDRVLKRAIERSLVPDAETGNEMSDAQVYELLFMPGFSTAETVTDISGRGVGLDVVRSNIEKIKGSVGIESEKGKGTTFRISIPLTTAIFDGMVVTAGGGRYILPVDRIAEIVRLGSGKSMQLGGRPMIEIRGEWVPLVSLENALGNLSPLATRFRLYPGHIEELLEPGEAPGSRDIVVIVRTPGRRFGLRLQAVLGQAQVVIKPLGSRFHGINEVSGAAIMGDGKVALILDLEGLARWLDQPTSPSSLVAAA